MESSSPWRKLLRRRPLVLQALAASTVQVVVVVVVVVVVDVKYGEKKIRLSLPTFGDRPSVNG